LPKDASKYIYPHTLTNSGLTSKRGLHLHSIPPLLRFSILAAISLAIWFRPLASSLYLALADDQFTHLLLILPVSLALIYLDWKSPEASTGLNLFLGALALAFALVVTAAAKLGCAALHADGQLSVDMLALVLWWIGAFAVCFGTRAVRRAAFPLGFLFWIIPLPGLLLNPIVRVLQEGSAAAAHLLFAAIGVPVSLDGMRMTIPGLTVEVARECSSIRSSSTLLVTTMVLSHLLLRSPWRKALAVAVAVPLSVAKNGLRIFTIAMLATRVSPAYLSGRLHHDGGIVFLAIALAAEVGLIWILRWAELQELYPPSLVP
jgi:exosortase